MRIAFLYRVFIVPGCWRENRTGLFFTVLEQGFSVYFRSAVDQVRLRAESMPLANMVIVDDASSVCAILFDAYMRVWPSGKAKASQAFIRGFESRHPLQVYASRRWVSVGGFFCFVGNALRALLSYDPSTSCRMRRGVLLRALVSDFRVPGHNFKGMYVPFLSVGDIRQS